MMTIAELKAALRDKAEEDAYEEYAMRHSLHQQWLEEARLSLAKRLEDSGLEYVFLEDEPVAIIECYQVRTDYAFNAYQWEVRRGNTAWACVNYVNGAERTLRLLQAMELADENYTDMLREAQDTDGENESVNPYILDNAEIERAIARLNGGAS